jgi:GMP synthase (glutamine-hydrolysing)
VRIHYLQHVPFEGLGSIEEWALEKGYTLSATRFYAHDPLPEIADIDWLIIMGGPMGVHDEDKYPWLPDEKKFIQQAIESGKTVIGICLGAQLIATILGSSVYLNKEKEIGWYPVQFTPDAKKQGLFHTEEPGMTIFHWHGDTFDLPRNAIRLAYSDACMNQAFLFNEKILGLQFHLETTKESLQQMVENGKNELSAGRYVQQADEIFRSQQYIPDNQRLLFSLLDTLAG